MTTENLKPLSDEEKNLIIDCLRFAKHTCGKVIDKAGKIDQLVEILDRSEAFVTA